MGMLKVIFGRSGAGLCLLALAAFGLLPGRAYALYPSDAYDLTDDNDGDGNPDPDRSIEVRFSTVEGAAGLRTYVEAQDGAANATVVLEAGTRSMTSANGPIKIGSATTSVTGLTIRGSSNNPTISQITGSGSVSHIFELWKSADIRFAYLTLRFSKTELIYLHGLSGGVRSIHFYRCNLIDGTGGTIYADGDATTGVGSSKVEFCNLGYSQSGAVLPSGYAFADDTDALGIKLEGGTSWTIRHNLFFWYVPLDYVNDYPMRDGTNHAIRITTGNSDTDIYGNIFHYCEVGVALGMMGNSDSTKESIDSLVRNNFFFRYEKRIQRPISGWPGWLGDQPDIQVCNSEGSKIYHNSQWHDPKSTAGALDSPFILVDSGKGDATISIRNNLTNKTLVDGTGTTFPENYLTTTDTTEDDHSHFTYVNNHWEYNPLMGHDGTWGTGLYPTIKTLLIPDPHLAAGALVPSKIVDKCVILADECPDDWDTGQRSNARTSDGGGATLADYGCDEYEIGRPPQQKDTGDTGGGGVKPDLPYLHLTSGTKTTNIIDTDVYAKYKALMEAKAAAAASSDLKKLARESNGSAYERLRNAIAEAKALAAASSSGGSSSGGSLNTGATKSTGSKAGAGLGN